MEWANFFLLNRFSRKEIQGIGNGVKIWMGEYGVGRGEKCPQPYETPYGVLWHTEEDIESRDRDD